MSERSGGNNDCGKPQPNSLRSKRTITSQALFGADRQICIRHKDTLYQLRITANDKLILTK